MMLTREEIDHIKEVQDVFKNELDDLLDMAETLLRVREYISEVVHEDFEAQTPHTWGKRTACMAILSIIDKED